jgi:hypothetical protein
MSSKNKFSRRHYLALADLMHQTEPMEKTEAAHMAWEISVTKMAWAFTIDNPRFRSDLFILACRTGAEEYTAYARKAHEKKLKEAA